MNTSHAPLLAGMLIGLSVAVPIGPMGLLCIQRTLASGMRIGWLTGLGAATVNAFYGAAIIFGFAQLEPFIVQGSRMLSAVGGLFLLWSAVRTLRRKRLATHSPGQVIASPSAAYGSAVLFNLTRTRVEEMRRAEQAEIAYRRQVEGWTKRGRRAPTGAASEERP